ncbi:MAG: carboxyl transferase [Proteobacteria bacterium]|nr:carboxyl transferase [Pseudomonadota bacterium]
MSMNRAIEELIKRREKALEMGGPDKVARQHERGHLTARERIERLLDPGSFFEIGLLVHSDVPGMEDKTAADGKIDGFGAIDGRPVAVRANDNTVMAGSGGRIGGQKSRRVSRMAVEKGYPIINLGEAGGARIPDIQGSDGLSTMTIGREYGLRGRRVPQVATIMGECFGDPSWAAAASDFVVQVKGSCMAVSGPRVLEIAKSENVTNETLGGWKLHAEVTGQIDRAAEDEVHAFEIVRDFLSYLPSSAEDLPPRVPADGDSGPRQKKMLEILPEQSNRVYDMHRVIKTLVDGECIFPIKPDFDRSVITCLARIDGHSVGFIANNPMHMAGAMGPDGCDKCVSFICLCDSYHVPLIFLHDTPGFLVGPDAEKKRMPGKIINFIEALGYATVPKVSIVVRKSYGMAYGNMGGSNMGVDFLYAWPTADISFMAPEVAANVVYAAKIAGAADPEAARAEAIAEMRLASAPWRAAGLGLLDDVIDPAQTRAVIIRSLELARGNSGGRSQRLLAHWPTTF